MNGKEYDINITVHYVSHLFSRVTSWDSKKEPIVSLSTPEGKYFAGTR